MLFLVISSPRPERPSEMLEARKSFWPWMHDLMHRGVATTFHARAGRGGIAVFSVENHEELHALLNAWSEFVPTSLEVLPLLDEGGAKRYLEERSGR